MVGDTSRVDLDIRAGLAAEDDDLEQRVRRGLDHVRNTVDHDHDILVAGAGRVSLLRNIDVVGAMIGSWQWRHHEHVVIDQVHCAGMLHRQRAPTVPKLIAVLGDELVACAITWY